MRASCCGSAPLHGVYSHFCSLIFVVALRRMQENLLGALPISFTELGSLTLLNLSHNRLKKLPPNIGGEEISLGPFVSIYQGGLRRLTDLDVSFNNIEEVPRSILGLTRLKSLQFDNNALLVIPDGLKRLKDCETLTIDVLALTVLKKLSLDDSLVTMWRHRGKL